MLKMFSRTDGPLSYCYIALFFLIGTANSLYLIFIFWDWQAFSKTDVLTLEVIFLLVQTFVYWQGFANGRRNFFPFPKWRIRHFVVGNLPGIAAMILVLLLTANPLWFVVLFMLAQQFIYGLVFLRLHKRMRPSTVHHKWTGIAVFVFILVILAGIFEPMNRRWFFGIFRPDPQMGVRLRENDKYRITQDGYRGSLVKTKDLTASPRILFLGDSSTFGVYVKADEAFPAQTEARLHQNGMPEAVAINAGVPGYNLFHLLHRLDEFAAFQPETVVVMSGYHWKAIAKYKAQYRHQLFTDAQQAVWHTLQYLEAHGITFLTFPFIIYLSQELWADEEDLSPPQQIALYTEALRELYERVTAKQARMIVVLYPSPMIEAQVQQINIDFAQEHDLTVIDLREHFNDDLLVDELHPNRDGHRALAEAVCRVLQEN